MICRLFFRCFGKTNCLGSCLGGQDLQHAKEEYAAQANLLPDLQIEAPDHWHCEAENHEVDQEIGDAVPAVESVLIDACPARDGLVPIKGDGRTFKDGDEESDNIIEEHNCPRDSENPAKPAHYSEDAVVEQEK